MHKVDLLMVAGLMVGCASLDDGSNVPTTAQEKAQNPDLLKCYTGVPICRTVGGHLQKSHRQCRCLDLSPEPEFEPQ